MVDSDVAQVGNLTLSGGNFLLMSSRSLVVLGDVSISSYSDAQIRGTMEAQSFSCTDRSTTTVFGSLTSTNPVTLQQAGGYAPRLTIQGNIYTATINNQSGTVVMEGYGGVSGDLNNAGTMIVNSTVPYGGGNVTASVTVGGTLQSSGVLRFNVFDRKAGLLTVYSNFNVGGDFQVSSSGTLPTHQDSYTLISWQGNLSNILNPALPSFAIGAGGRVFYSTTSGEGGAGSWRIAPAANVAPRGANNGVATPENTSYVFASAAFGFDDSEDSPADEFLAVKITTLPEVGVLKFDGENVTEGQFIPIDSIASLLYYPPENQSGAALASFTFQVQDDGGTQDGGVDLDQTPRTITINVIAAQTDLWRDAFTDADYTSLGSHSPDQGSGGYTVAAGAMGVDSNRLKATGFGNSVLGSYAALGYFDSGAAQTRVAFDFSLDYNAMTFPVDVFVILRYDPSSQNGFVARITSTGMFLYQLSGGTLTQLDYVSLSLNVNTTYALSADNTASGVSVTVDGNTLSYSSTTGNTETRIGFGFVSYSDDGCPSWIDNLAVTDL